MSTARFVRRKSREWQHRRPPVRVNGWSKARKLSQWQAFIRRYGHPIWD